MDHNDNILLLVLNNINEQIKTIDNNCKEFIINIDGFNKEIIVNIDNFNKNVINDTTNLLRSININIDNNESLYNNTPSSPYNPF